MSTDDTMIGRGTATPLTLTITCDDEAVRKQCLAPGVENRAFRLDRPMKREEGGGDMGSLIFISVKRQEPAKDETTKILRALLFGDPDVDCSLFVGMLLEDGRIDPDAIGQSTAIKLEGRDPFAATLDMLGYDLVSTTAEAA